MSHGSCDSYFFNDYSPIRDFVMAWNYIPWQHNATKYINAPRRKRRWGTCGKIPQMTKPVKITCTISRSGKLYFLQLNGRFTCRLKNEQNTINYVLGHLSFVLAEVETWGYLMYMIKGWDGFSESARFTLLMKYW